MEVSEIRPKILKWIGQVALALYILFLLEVFQPEVAKAGMYDNAYTFYQSVGNNMRFVPGEEREGYIYYGTKAKKDFYTGIRYVTLGWRIRVFNSNGALADTLYYQLGGAHMNTLDVRIVDGYEYRLYRVSLSNIRKRLSGAGVGTMHKANSSIVFDACTTTSLNGVIQGGMTDEGPSWGSVYTTYNGIVNAQNWTPATKETLKTYYNKTVEGLFYNLNLQKGTGIQTVHGAGKYCFGTPVIISADVKDGYHFKEWQGNQGAPIRTYSVTVYASDVNLVAQAEENIYHIAYDANGGIGDIATQDYTYNQNLILPVNGFSKDGASIAGWEITTDAGTIQYIRGQRVSIKNVVKRLNLQRTNGATVVFRALWDEGPIIQAEDIYISLKDAKEGKITEEWLAKRVNAFDQEDGVLPYGHTDKTSFYIQNFRATHYTSIPREGKLKETFVAKDRAGNITQKTVQIYVVDTELIPPEKYMGKVRFISKKYYKGIRNSFVSPDKGGLELDSVWRLEKAYRDLLDALFVNQR
ncbi:MAG: InlB B-repeat-containing protein [Agathobacter sp.]|nr:InlB B-repeat-containing protein [Agathobacter sp.]